MPRFYPAFPQQQWEFVLLNRVQGWVVISLLSRQDQCCTERPLPLCLHLHPTILEWTKSSSNFRSIHLRWLRSKSARPFLYPTVLTYHIINKFSAHCKALLFILQSLACCSSSLFYFHLCNLRFISSQNELSEIPPKSGQVCSTWRFGISKPWFYFYLKWQWYKQTNHKS